ncbi:50S ribosomal protein L11 methyltransferase [Allobacillus sp. GCM10007491]|uniref:Ribosomal protein L11 methyltransferase n=1 Tax=Allobacillus saliphilus TaxID=2912308 RepID=A0A941CW91_9BACI|nr:50S ribosomal protein L11 methyltransferase [Allobacillus saliphilus]MBR7553335.1 50S ribosomal protein L11 methyltransferase [Allobacillus saliphilus]
MTWSEIKIHTTNEAIEAVSHIFQEAGASGVVIVDPQDLYKDHVTLYGTIYELDASNYPDDGVYVKSYLPTDDSLAEKVSFIKQSISELPNFNIPIGRNEVTISEVHEEDWSTAWKKYYKPVKVSDHITIKPTWEDYQPSSNELIIELDPGMAFGTGTHPTTVLSLQALERFLKPNNLVLDVGSGSGILSIAAAKLGASHVYAFDLDEVAVTSTQNNSTLNQTDELITVQKNDLLKNVQYEPDVIVSNILAEIIIQLTEDAFHLLKPNGLLITSGIIQKKKQEVLNDLTEKGFQVIETKELDDWVSIVAQKPNATKKGLK